MTSNPTAMRNMEVAKLTEREMIVVHRVRDAIRRGDADRMYCGALVAIILRLTQPLPDIKENE